MLTAPQPLLETLKKLSPELFYTEEGAGIEYTAMPTGDLDAPRMVSQEDEMWRKMAKAMKPKTLVLTDWTEVWDRFLGEAISDLKTEAMIERFLALIEEGERTGEEVTIYVWPDLNTKLTRKNIHKLRERYCRNNITPVHEKDVYESLSHKIGADQIYVLDPISLQSIFRDKPDAIRAQITTDDLFDGNGALKYKENEWSVITEQLQKQKNVIIEGVRLDAKTASASASASGFDIVKQRHDWLFKKNNVDEITPLFEQENYRADRITLHGIDNASARKILRMASLVKQIEIFSKLDSVEIPLDKFNALEMLSIMNNDVGIFRAFAENAPRLKLLRLGLKINNFEQLNDLSKGALSNITSLIFFGDADLGQIQSSEKFIALLLSKPNSLENLEISGDRDLRFLQKIPMQHIQKITRLAFSGNTDLDLSTLDFLIKNSNNLKSLNLSGCNLLRRYPKEEIDLLDLSKIESLTVNFDQSVLPLLARTTKLRYLGLIYCSDLSKSTIIENMPPESFSHLEHIDCGATSLSDAAIDFILQNATKLDVSSKIALENARKEVKEDYRPAEYPIQEKETSVDADTMQRNPTFHVNKIFRGVNGNDPHPALCRLQRYNKFTLNDGLTPFVVTDTLSIEDLRLEAPAHTISFADTDLYSSLETLTNNRPPDSTQTYYYAKQKLLLSSEQWTRLPSLLCNEVLTHVHLDGIDKSQVEIQRSPVDDFYYIRKKPLKAVTKAEDALETPTPITIDFILHTPEPVEVIAAQPISDDLPEGIRAIIKFCQNFGIGDCGLTPDMTGIQRLSLLIEKRMGACRHRSMVFAAMMQEQFPEIAVFTIGNDVHMYSEIVFEGKRYRCDFGGYPADIKIIDDEPPLGAPLSQKNLPLPANTRIAKTVPVVPVVANVPKHALAASQFTTWISKKTIEINVTQYFLNIVRGVNPETNENNVNKVIVQLEEHEINAASLLIQKICLDTSKPVFYINSPEELACYRCWLERDKTISGTPPKTYGGRLHRFLTAEYPEDVTPVLLINWNNFKPNDLVKFNTILDDDRKIDGVPLPKKMRVIGLYNANKPNAYKGSDFWGRNDRVTQYSFGSEKLLRKAKSLTEIISPSDSPATVSFDLFNSPNWKALLLGQWVVDGRALHFREGLLEKALREMGDEATLEIKNGPWDDPKFVNFWQQLKLHKILEIEGKKIVFPENLRLQRQDKYDWRLYDEKVVWKESSRQEKITYLLNPGMFNNYLPHYIIDNNTHTPCLQEGWLAAHKGATISIYVTHELLDQQWAALLAAAAAKENNVTLQIQVAPGVRLPAGIKPEPPVAESKADAGEEVKAQGDDVQISPSPGLNNSIEAEVVLCDDVDYAVAVLEAKNPGIFSLDVSAFNYTNLFTNYERDPGDAFSFYHKTAEIWEKLAQGETVLLSGHCEPELVDFIAGLYQSDPHVWINGEKVAPKGKLIVVPKNKEAFGFAQGTHRPAPTTREAKIEALQQYAKKYTGEPFDDAAYANLPPGDLSRYSFVQLKSMLYRPNNWEGLQTLDRSKRKPVSLDLDSNISKAFEQERVNLLMGTLAQYPFAFIAGESGVGKSTFMRKVLPKQHNVNVFYGEEGLANWLIPPANPNITQILFFDEVNITANNLSQYKGLFKNPQYILVGDTIHYLSPQQKVVFAGNPVSYGARNLPDFIKDHGGSIVFDPPPPAAMYHEILQPLLTSLAPDEQEKVGKAILTVYEYVNRLKSDTVLITPRELEMMAQYVSMFHQAAPGNLNAHIHYSLYEIASGVVPDKDKAEFRDWYARTLAVPPISPAVPIEEVKDAEILMIRGKRQAVARKIRDLLRLRKYRQTTQNDNARYAGLGGILFESEPGEGKSTFIKKLLVSEGFTERDITSTSIPENDFFYSIPANLSKADLVPLVLKAFNEGVPILPDEINSMPVLEEILNDILMGYYENKRPIKPGFCLIGSQNPIAMAGRMAQSIALLRRLMKVDFPSFTPLEMQDILVEEEGLQPALAKLLVNEYCRERQYAKHYRKDPAPTFRDLIKKAKVFKKSGVLPLHYEVVCYPEKALANMRSDPLLLKDPITLKCVIDQLVEMDKPSMITNIISVIESHRLSALEYEDGNLLMYILNNYSSEKASKFLMCIPNKIITELLDQNETSIKIKSRLDNAIKEGNASKVKAIIDFLPFDKVNDYLTAENKFLPIVQAAIANPKPTIMDVQSSPISWSRGTYGKKIKPEIEISSVKIDNIKVQYQENREKDEHILECELIDDSDRLLVSLKKMEIQGTQVGAKIILTKEEYEKIKSQVEEETPSRIARKT